MPRPVGSLPRRPGKATPEVGYSAGTKRWTDVRNAQKLISATKLGKRGLVMLSIGSVCPGHEIRLHRVTVKPNVTLRQVVRYWAIRTLNFSDTAHLPDDVHVTNGDPDGASLDWGATLHEIRPHLHVRDGRVFLNILWPFEKLPVVEISRKSSVSRRAGLNKIRPSTRYANVSSAIMMYNRSTTFQEKAAAGEYEFTKGLYIQADYAAAMRTPALVPSSVSLSDKLTNIDLRVSVNDDTEVTVRLDGPASLVENWHATCNKFETLKQEGKSLLDTKMPFPVFIPSKGRPLTANLNYEAAHVFGPAPPEGLQPVVLAVVEPAEEALYREAWPRALLMILPRNDGGPGYVRWLIQRICTKCSVLCGMRRKVLQIPWVWICDDFLTMFYRLVPLVPPKSQWHHFWAKMKTQRRKQRTAVDGAPMFKEAMLSMQSHPFLERAAVCGFLRDDGTAVCKKLDWKKDEISMYKVVLLNIHQLANLGIEYIPDIKMYEDLCLNHQVLRKHADKGHTLKCQGFCFWATHATTGGCTEQRANRPQGNEKTVLDDICDADKFKQLPSNQQQTILELLEWIRTKEQTNASKAEKMGMPVPITIKKADRKVKSEKKKPSVKQPPVRRLMPTLEQHTVKDHSGDVLVEELEPLVQNIGQVELVDAEPAQVLREGGIDDDLSSTSSLSDGGSSDDNILVLKKDPVATAERELSASDNEPILPPRGVVRVKRTVSGAGAAIRSTAPITLSKRNPPLVRLRRRSNQSGLSTEIGSTSGSVASSTSQKPETSSDLQPPQVCPESRRVSPERPQPSAAFEAQEESASSLYAKLLTKTLVLEGLQPARAGDDPATTRRWRIFNERKVCIKDSPCHHSATTGHLNCGHEFSARGPFRHAVPQNAYEDAERWLLLSEASGTSTGSSPGRAFVCTTSPKDPEKIVAERVITKDEDDLDMDLIHLLPQQLRRDHLKRSLRRRLQEGMCASPPSPVNSDCTASRNTEAHPYIPAAASPLQKSENQEDASDADFANLVLPPTQCQGRPSRPTSPSSTSSTYSAPSEKAFSPRAARVTTVRTSPVVAHRQEDGSDTDTDDLRLAPPEPQWENRLRHDHAVDPLDPEETEREELDTRGADTRRTSSSSSGPGRQRTRANVGHTSDRGLEACLGLPEGWEQVSRHPEGAPERSWRVSNEMKVSVRQRPSHDSERLRYLRPGEIFQARGLFRDGLVGENTRDKVHWLVLSATDGNCPEYACISSSKEPDKVVIEEYNTAEWEEEEVSFAAPPLRARPAGSQGAKEDSDVVCVSSPAVARAHEDEGATPPHVRVTRERARWTGLEKSVRAAQSWATSTGTRQDIRRRSSGLPQDLTGASHSPTCWSLGAPTEVKDRGDRPLYKAEALDSVGADSLAANGVLPTRVRGRRAAPGLDSGALATSRLPLEEEPEADRTPESMEANPDGPDVLSPTASIEEALLMDLSPQPAAVEDAPEDMTVKQEPQDRTSSDLSSVTARPRRNVRSDDASDDAVKESALAECQQLDSTPPSVRRATKKLKLKMNVTEERVLHEALAPTIPPPPALFEQRGGVRLKRPLAVQACSLPDPHFEDRPELEATPVGRRNTPGSRESSRIKHRRRQVDSVSPARPRKACGDPRTSEMSAWRSTDIASDAEYVADIFDAVCRVCAGRDATDENDLGICDGCNMAFHQFCHVPAVVSFGLSEDNWFCGECERKRSMYSWRHD